MPFIVYKSQILDVADDFPAAVEAYRQALLAHRFAPPAQLEVPARAAIPANPAIPPTAAKGRFPAKPGRPGHPGRPAVPGIPANPGVPRPTTHALIESCIKRVPQPSGPDEYVTDYEIIDDIPPTPVLSLRDKKDRLLLGLGASEKLAVDKIWPVGKRRLDMMKANIISQKAEADRAPNETDFFNEFLAKQTAMQKVEMHSAELMSEIEDLTEDNIDSWSGKL